MHLASCSAKKGLPVPDALPDSLAALLLRGRPGLEEGAAAGAAAAAAAAAGGGGGKPTEKGRKPKQKGEKSSARSSAGGGTGKGQKGKRERAGKGDGKETEEAAAADKEAKPSRKRGFGMLSSSSAGAATGAKKSPTPESGGVAAAAANNRGGKKKRPKREKLVDGGNHARGKENAAADDDDNDDGKRRSSSGKNTPPETKQPADGASKGKQTKGSSTTAAAATAAASGVISAGDSTEGLAAAEGLAGGKETGGIGAEDCSAADATADNAGDDEQGTGAQEGDAPRKTATSAKKPLLSREERDQLYAMTTSERAGYDVVFMQVLLSRFSLLVGVVGGPGFASSFPTRRHDITSLSCLACSVLGAWGGDHRQPSVGGRLKGENNGFAKGYKSAPGGRVQFSSRAPEGLCPSRQPRMSAGRQTYKARTTARRHCFSPVVNTKPAYPVPHPADDLCRLPSFALTLLIQLVRRTTGGKIATKDRCRPQRDD